MADSAYSVPATLSSNSARSTVLLTFRLISFVCNPNGQWASLTHDRIWMTTKSGWRSTHGRFGGHFHRVPELLDLLRRCIRLQPKPGDCRWSGPNSVAGSPSSGGHFGRKKIDVFKIGTCNVLEGTGGSPSGAARHRGHSVLTRAVSWGSRQPGPPPPRPLARPECPAELRGS